MKLFVRKPKEERQKMAQDQIGVDLRQPVLNFLNRPTAEQEKEQAHSYLLGLSKKHEVRPFTSDDILAEVSRRTAENAKMSAALEHPAMKAAFDFDENVAEAEMLIGHNVSELGCKWLAQGIVFRRDIVTEMKLQLKDLAKEAINNDELVAKLKKMHEAGDVKGFNEVIAEINANKEAGRATQIARAHIADYVETLKAEIKLLTKVMKHVRDDATPTQKALIDAQMKAAAVRSRERRCEEYGRPINMVAKPILKSYKMMAFKAKDTMAQFMPLINKINKAALDCSDVWHDKEATDDMRVVSKKNLLKVYDEVLAELKSRKEKGEKVRLDVANCKIHNARESQLTDIIGVIYGKTTDMVISVSHNVAAVFNFAVKEMLNEDAEEANRMIRAIMREIVGCFQNGCDVTDNNKKVHEFVFWNANNASLKVGNTMFLSKAAYERVAEVGRAGMTEEEFEELHCTGSDLLKWWSYATTPGCPLAYEGENLTINDVLVLPSISVNRTFLNVLRFNEDGTKNLFDRDKIERTAFDGSLWLMVNIPSQQMRGGFAFKGFGVCCAYEDGTTIVDEIARREGLEIPEYVMDVDGVMRRWRDYKVICTADAWKWAGWKFGTEGAKFTYAEYCERMNKLAEKYPCANKLYTARIADATEESKRRLTRQSIQQFIFATHTQLEQLYSKSIGKLRKWSSHDEVLMTLAGLTKDEDSRSAFEHLIEVCPEILDNPLMKRNIEDMFNRAVAEAAVRPEVNGIYPYLAEDPVAFFKIALWGMNPNEMNLGYLKSIEVNAPCMKDGIELYLVRYPNNFLCGRVRKQKNDDIYRCVGNVIILSLDGGYLIIADGDSDGDEVFCGWDKVVVDMMKKTLHEIQPPIVVFPHDSLKKKIVHGREARKEMIADAIVIANMYGPEVGKNSNLATKFFHRAAIAYAQKKFSVFEGHLSNAILAHIAAIIAIDLAKTGKMPGWLKKQLDDNKKYAGKNMPWNQRFCKDNKSTPWFSKKWDEVTLKESDAVCDRGARYLIDAVRAENYKAPTKDGFDIHSLLGSKNGLDVQGTMAKLYEKQLKALESRNYREKNSEGDNEYKLIETLKSPDENDRVSPIDLIRFLWRNKASLVYVLQKEGSDKIDNALMQNAYYDFCHGLLVDFGAFGAKKASFAKLDVETRRRSNIYKFLEYAFDEKNSIGKELNDDDEQQHEERMSKRASFCLFTVKVFAYDLYLMRCAQLGYTPWIKPVSDESTDVASDCDVEQDLEIMVEEVA